MPVKARLGKRPQSSAFERLSEGPVAPEARRRRSRNDRNLTSRRPSIPRWVKAKAKAKEDAEAPTKQETSKLDVTLVGFRFPVQDETTTDSDSDTPEPKK